MLSGRESLLKQLGPASELIYDATSAVCVGYSYTADVKGLFVNLAAYPKHVTLVFSYGAFLDDPAGVLKGEGKQVRHVRLSGIEHLEDPYLKALILLAEEQAKRPPVFIPARQIFKVYSGPKRRPNP